jgi:hypothetical protein
MHRDRTTDFTVTETTWGQVMMRRRETKSAIRKLRTTLIHLQQTVSPIVLCELVECQLEEAEAMYKLDR